MSFLNPVNEPVLAFSSADIGAPQIPPTRVAGDISNIIKACLVTGYGGKPSAGWSIISEVGNSIVFSTPDLVMGDYAFGIDDSTSLTSWSYTYQGSARSLATGSINKSFSGTLPDPVAGWRLLVTGRGFVFVEIKKVGSVNSIISRVTCFCQIKSGLNVDVENMYFINFGLSSNPSIGPRTIVSSASSSYRHITLGSSTSIQPDSSNMQMFSVNGAPSTSELSLSSEIYFYADYKFIGKCPFMLIKTPESLSDAYGVKEVLVNDRPMLHVCVSLLSADGSTVQDNARVVVIPLDYWEF